MRFEGQQNLTKAFRNNKKSNRESERRITSGFFPLLLYQLGLLLSNPLNQYLVLAEQSRTTKEEIMEEHLASSHIAQKATSDPIHAAINQRLSLFAIWLLTGSVNT